MGEILEAYERKGWLQDTAIVFSSDRTMGMLSRSVALSVSLILKGVTIADGEMLGDLVSRHDIAGIWVAFFSRCQRHRC